MSNGPLWSVKGVDDETRELARRAAEASGLTIGNWIDTAILRRTAPPEAPPATPIQVTSPSPPVPAPATASPNSAVNGVHPPEAAGPPRPPPRFVRLIEEPLPPLEPIRSFEELDRALARTRRGSRVPSTATLAAGAGIVFVAAAVWLGVEFFSHSSGPGAEIPAPPAIADAAAAQPNGLAHPNAASGEGAVLVARLRADAERGDAFAENDLGLLYATGRHVSVDEREAFKWFERAAAKGLVSAKFNMGAMYQRGRGVPVDPQLAVQWYRRAADEGHIMAQHNLATMYSRGDGVPQDYRTAVRLYRQAAEAGFAASQFRLAELHENGLGVQKDRKTAIEWYGRAAAQGVERAQEMVRRLQGDPLPIATVRDVPTNAAKSGAARDTIREAQRLLSALSFDPGAVDGRQGPQTERAIRDFQRMAGLQITGVVSPELIEELKAVAQPAR